MISAYVGLPGSGKSYAVVGHVILPALRQGRRVVTNVPLKRDAIRKITPKGEIVEFPMDAVATNPDSIEDYCTAGSVVVLDEVWRLWPAGQKSHQVPVPFRSLLAEHRHRKDAKGNTMSVVLVTQDLQQISAWARSLIETTFVHTKLNALGAPTKFRVASYRGPVETNGPPQNRLIRESLGTYKKDVFSCYTSHTMAETETGAVNESPIDKRANFWRRPSVWAGAVFAIAAPAWALSTLYGLVSPEPAESAVASEASHSAPAAPAPAVERARARPEREPPSVEPVAVRRQVPNYRVAGVVRSADKEREGFAAIERDGRQVVMPLSSCWFAGDGLTRCSVDGHTVTEFGVE